MSTLFSRILVGVDESDASQEAVVFAARLAREHGGELVCAHAVNWLPVVAQIASSGAIMDPTPLVDDLKAEGNALLDRAVETAKRGGVDAQRIALEGEPAQSILDRAAEEACTLIVMGTHGRDGLQRLFAGSTTEAVLRGSEVPVLTVRVGTTFTAPPERCFATIVAGIDESEPSIAAVQTILDLPPEDRQRVGFYSVAGSSEDDHDRAHRLIGRAVSAANTRGISAKGRVIGGAPGEALIAVAQQQAADLIVVGSHGRQGVERLFLGSVAESIVRNSPLPVLVVRKHGNLAVTERVRAA